MESAAGTAGGKRTASSRVPPEALVFGLWLAIGVATYVWAVELQRSGVQIVLNAPPMAGGFYEPAVSPLVAVPVALAAAVAWFGPVLARTMRWGPLLAVAALTALAWPAALNLADGSVSLAEPLDHRNEYLTAIPLEGSPGEFLSSFTDRIDGYATHVRGHPPGMVMVLWGLDAIGLGGSGPAAALILLIAASAVPAVMIAARAVAGQEVARRAAPFLVLAPAAIWIATTADALYMGVGAWAITATLLALLSRGRRSILLAAAGGVLFGLCLMFSYGLVLLGVVPLAVAASRRRVAPLAIALAACLAVLAVPLAAGFNWIEGFFAIREQYLESVARGRPYEFFLFNNLTAFGLALGPATVLALARPRSREAWLLVGGGLLMAAAADLSGMSKAEVERIWLPFLPWVMLATAALWQHRALLGGLLVLQAVVAVAIELGTDLIW